MKWLVTGSTGFIGSYLTKEYQDQHTIIPFSLLKNKWEELVLDKIDSVVHLAAVVHQMEAKPWEFYEETNVHYPVELAKRAKKAGVRHFLFLSSIKACGEESNVPYTEKSLCSPQDPYGRSKLKAEKALLELADNSFAVSILRTPVVYGPGVKANILNLVKLVDRIPVLPFGCTENSRSMVYIRNLTALMECLCRKHPTGIYIASDPYPFPTSRYVEWIAEALGKKRILLCIPFIQQLLYRIKPHLHARLFGNLVVDDAQTRHVLDFDPPYSTKEGVADMVTWYKRYA